MGALDSSTHMGMMMAPIAQIMFWAAVWVFGMLVYRAGFFMAPKGGKKPPAEARAPTRGPKGRERRKSR